MHSTQLPPGQFGQEGGVKKRGKGVLLGDDVCVAKSVPSQSTCTTIAGRYRSHCPPHRVQGFVLPSQPPEQAGSALVLCASHRKLPLHIKHSGGMQRKDSDQHRDQALLCSPGADVPSPRLATRLLFLAAYLAVDLAYVLASKNFYEETVIAIQGTGLPGGRVPDALVAYALLALGWLCIAMPSAKLWVDQGYRPAAAGAIAGFMYGAVLYGVYNFTLRAEFEQYGLGIALRDTAWGATSAALMNALYAHMCLPQR